MPTLSLVIPAYNEEARLPDLLATISREADAIVAASGFELTEVLIVNDGSDDGTPEILREAEAEQAKLKAVLGSGQNRGKGAAFASGVGCASGDYVLLTDVDLSTPLQELPKLAAAVDAGADIAIGSRAIEGAIVERGPVHRKLLGKGFNATVRALTGLPIKDTQCGFKLLPTNEARALLSDQRCPGFAFDVELLMRADRAGLTVAEVPVLYLHDSRSSVNVTSASLRMLRDVCSLAYQLRLRGGGRRSSRVRLLAGVSADDPD